MISYQIEMMMKSMLLNVVEVNEVEDTDEEEEDCVQDDEEK